jgi:hypothetical protein
MSSSVAPARRTPGAHELRVEAPGAIARTAGLDFGWCTAVVPTAPPQLPSWFAEVLFVSSGVEGGLLIVPPPPELLWMIQVWDAWSLLGGLALDLYDRV